jgi:hypothetical protein
MANTPNIDLVKPAGTDHALVSVLNSNSDKIDTFAGTTNAAIANRSRVNLSSATDFNTLLRDGTNLTNKYYRGENLGVHSNIPSGSWSNTPFALDVIPLGGLYTLQKLTLYNAVTPYEFIRQNYYSSSTPYPWTGWNNIAGIIDITLTAGSNVTISTQDSYKLNGLLYVNVMLTVNTALSQNDNLFTLPSGMVFSRRTDWQTHNGTLLVGLANNSNFFVTTGTLATGSYVISFCCPVK